MSLQSGQYVYPAQLPGWVGESTRSSAVNLGSPNTETVLQSLTFTADSAARYKITAVQSVQSSVAADLMQLRLRWQAGAAVTSAGTEVLTQLINQDIAGKGQIITSVITVTGLSGQVTVGVTAVRAGGTGAISSFGNVQQTNTLLVERV